MSINAPIMFSVTSIQLADSIDIRSFRNLYDRELLFYDSDEMFYRTGDNKFVYVFAYGSAGFLGWSESEIQSFLSLIKPFCRNATNGEMRENLEIGISATENKYGYSKIEITDPSVEALRLIILNVSQSVALDYYSQRSALLLDATTEQTTVLELKGKLSISGRRLKRFIGQTINLKNRITENLYIFDAPGTWDNEYLFRIDTELKKIFDIQSRYRNTQEELEIIKDNLGLFVDLMHQRKSNMLEIVVIILILVEVVNIVVEKFL